MFRMTASAETLETVRSLSRRGLQIRLRHRHREPRRRRPASTRTRSASSRPRRTSRNGCSNGGSRRSAPGGRWRSRIGPSSSIAPIDYQAATYYSAPKQNAGPKSLDEVDPELLRTYEKLGIPLREREALAGVAVDAVFDSVSVATTFKEQLGELGIIFCSFGEAVREHPELVRKYLGTVVPQNDNFFAALNSAVFSDGSFAYIPPGVRCPMELSHLFPHQCREDRPVRAHAADRRQGRLCQLSRRLHRAAARREPAPRRGRRADRA